MDCRNDKVPLIHGGIIFAKLELPLHRRDGRTLLPLVVPCNLLVVSLIFMGVIRVLLYRTTIRVSAEFIHLKACLM